MINPSKLFAITAIGLCLGVNMLQGSNTDTNDLNQHSKTTRTINPRSTVALMRTMAVFLASTGTEAFKTPPPHTPKQNPNFTGHISRHSELFSEQNLNEQIDAPHKIDPFVLANQRFATIGTSYEEYVSELRGPGTFSDRLMILGPTILGELAVFTNAFQNLSPIQLLGTGIIGYLSADLIVGLYHFAMDKVDWTSQAVPYQIKRSAIYFNLHQDVPSDCARFSYWDLTRASYLTNLKILTISRVLSLLGYPLPSFFLAVTNLIATQRQFFHALAHRNPTQNNGFIKFLQNNHIILNPQFHNKHHIPPYESHFCILTGHMNGVLDSMINAGRRIHGFFANNTKQD